MNRIDTKTQDLAMIGLMVALLEVVKITLQFIPNVELVSFLFIIFARWFGRKTYLASYIFVGVECLIWGFGTWTFIYLYIWQILITAVLLLPKRDDALWYGIISGIFGLSFGALSALSYLFIGGPSMAVSWWVSGIPFDLIHGVSNLIICLVLFRPVDRTMRKNLHR